jgi:peptidoglycan/LPS O-acetylase OafA/YrhL
MLTPASNAHSASESPHAANRIHQLDGLRGLLAVFVALFHLQASFSDLPAFLLRQAPIFLQGWYAVDVFFVMSGFVMLHVYGETFANGVTPRLFLNFMWARVVRLYPVHLFALLATMVLLLPMLVAHHELLLAWRGRYSLGTFFASLFMLQSPWVDYRSWNYPAWSISAEWHAYLVFPLLVLMLRNCSARMSWVLIGLGVAVPLLLYLPPYEVEQYPTNGLEVLFRVIPLFIVGMALHTIWLRVRRMPAALGWLALLGTLVLLSFPALAPFAVLLVPLLVLSVLRTPWLERRLSTVPLLWLGKISYSLYMMHALIQSFVLNVTVHHLQRWLGADFTLGIGAALCMWLVGAGLSVLLGWATWKWVEVPLRRVCMHYNGAFSKSSIGTVHES